MRPPVIKNLNIEKGRRIIAVSDIHGNLDYFKKLLDKIDFGGSDVLIICGDFLEKGERSLETLRFIMGLKCRAETHVICGNCDSWPSALLLGGEDFGAQYTQSYLRAKPQALISQMCAEIGFDISGSDAIDFPSLRQALLREFSEQAQFLLSLPTIIETPFYTFVHGGIPAAPREQWTAYSCMKNDNFLGQGRRFDKWIIVGHWPVMLYRESIVNANPLIDSVSKIISIDGGCVLKDDGQLNALIIPEMGSEDFGFEYYCGFETAIAKTAQAPSEKSYYIRFGDNEVEILSRGDEFCRCRHLRTGYEMDILTKYIRQNEGGFTVNDCTDYALEVKVGDEISIVERCSRGYFAKRNGISGWYYGEIG